MNKKVKKILEHKRVILIIIVLIIILISCGILINKTITKVNFAKYNIKFSKNNEEQIFNIDKIILYSSANVVDSSQDQSLTNLKIYQYTDIAIYLNNGNELTNQNTVKRLYIDNMSYTGNSNYGAKSLNYKNPMEFGIAEYKDNQSDTIEFNIIKTNSENEGANYDDPSFYTDCSNPIVLEYCNRNLVTGYKLKTNDSITFNGSILKSAGVNLNDIQNRVIFKLNIVNNNDEKFFCWIGLDIPLNNIYDGEVKETLSGEQISSEFIKE